MVPNAEVKQTLPDTLPADFGEWDGQAAAPPSPKKPDAVASNVAAPKPPVKPVAARAGLSLVADRLPEPAFLTPVAVGPRVDLSYADVEDPEWSPQPEGKNKKMLIVAGSASALILLLIIVFSLNHHSQQAKTSPLNQSHALPSQSVALPATNAQPATKPSAATPAANDPAAATQPAPAVHVQADMMNDQLSAAAVIPQNIKTTAAKETPPASGFTVASMDGLGGSDSSAGSVFNGQAGSQVKVLAPAKVSISAGVASGLAIHKTAPFYPAIAKTARVSGTVVLGAVISKTGAIQKLRVISGPSMLQQSALDAVKSWRYKPYMLNNEPVDVETTVNVVFALGD